MVLYHSRMRRFIIKICIYTNKEETIIKPVIHSKRTYFAGGIGIAQRGYWV